MSQQQFSEADVRAAVYAAHIDHLAAFWRCTPEDAIQYEEEQEAVASQPTTLTRSERARQPSLFALDLAVPTDDPALASWHLTQYQHGKAVLAAARLISVPTKRQIAALASPVIRDGGRWHGLARAAPQATAS